MKELSKLVFQVNCQLCLEFRVLVVMLKNLADFDWLGHVQYRLIPYRTNQKLRNTVFGDQYGIVRTMAMVRLSTGLPTLISD
jgi:hypothetical protein